MNEEKRPLGIFTGEGLRKILMEHPELPVVFQVNTEEFTGEYKYEFASSAIAQIGEILDCVQDIDECWIFVDRDSFEDSVRDSLPYGLTDDEVQAEVAATLAEYEPYWKKCIIVMVGN